jgi:hypothetical protein
VFLHYQQAASAAAAFLNKHGLSLDYGSELESIIDERLSAIA